MLHYNLFKKKIKRQLLHQIIFYLLLFILLLSVCLLVNQKGMFIFLYIYLITLIYPLYKIIYSYLKLNKPILKDEVKLVNRELNKPLFEGMTYTLTENYFIDNSNFNFIKYEDILLIEKSKKLVLSASLDWLVEMLYISTKDGNYGFITKDFLLLNNSNTYLEDLSDFIKIKNPDVLIGNTEENREKIKAKFGVNIKINWKKYLKVILDIGQNL